MLDIHEFTHPSDHTDAGWAALCTLIRNYDHELIGGPEWDLDDESMLASANAETDHRRRRFIAEVDGVAVGYASLRINLRDDPEAGSVLVYVDPRHRRRGIGEALATRLADAVREESLERATSWITTPPADGARLVPPGGAGAAPADHAGVRMALRHGFDLAQIERVSRYDIAAPLVDPSDAHAEAQRVAGPDYEVITWEGETPDGIADDLAALKERMTTDVPTGNLTVKEAKWDAARIRENDHLVLATNRYYRAIVRHAPSGRVVALNELVRDRNNPVAFVEQWDTVVSPDHRGRRLGMLVKAANLLQLRELDPSATAIVTWNAEENRHMLGVNEALGFRGILVEAAFERRF